MDLRRVEQLMKDSQGGITEKKEAIISSLAATASDYGDYNKPEQATDFDSATALQLFLDNVPVSSIPGIKGYPLTGVEIKTSDCVGDGIRLMYERNTYGALIADTLDTGLPKPKFLDAYVGFINLPSMILWFLKEYEDEQSNIHIEDYEKKEITVKGFFSMLERYPRLAETKIGELAKSFLWDPFFPVYLEDTLFHVLLLFSKHRLHVVPVAERTYQNIVGFVSQTAVARLLLESSGLGWFDSIADKTLSEFRMFGNFERAVKIYGDQTVAEAMHTLGETRTGVVAVIERESEVLIGCVSSNSVRLLLQNDDLCDNRKSMRVAEFIHLDVNEDLRDPPHGNNHEDLNPTGVPSIRYNFLPRMNLPVTNRKTDTLNQAMRNFIDNESTFSFLVDESKRVLGLITMWDVILQFAPPCMDSTINGGTFFELALEQTRSHVEQGSTSISLSET